MGGFRILTMEFDYLIDNKNYKGSELGSDIMFCSL
jgi:hypothetical protein